MFKKILISMGASALLFSMSPERAEKLGIDEKQLEAINELEEDHKSSIREFRIKLKEIGSELRSKLKEENVKIKDLEPLLEEVNDLQYDQSLAMYEHQLAIKNILTQEQWLKFLEQRGHRRGKQHQEDKKK